MEFGEARREEPRKQKLLENKQYSETVSDWKCWTIVFWRMKIVQYWNSLIAL